MIAPTRSATEPGRPVTRPADRRVFVAVAVAAVGTDIAVRSGVATVAGAGLVVAVAVALWWTDRLVNPHARALAAGAAVFGCWIALRTSPWLIPFDILAAAALLALASSLAGEGHPAHLSVPELAVRARSALGHIVMAPAFLIPARSDGRSTSRAALLRGLVLALPVLAVLGALLASADAVFAGFFRFSPPATLVSHAALMIAGGWGMAGLLRSASAHFRPSPPTLAFRLGGVEAVVVVGSMVALFSAFAVAQLVAVSEGGRRVIETAGLTYAEYARSGFFQLLAVTGVTLVTLSALRAATDLADPRQRRRFTVLAEVAVALTLIIVVVALRRLALYDATYGLTMLRLYSAVFAVWIGCVFLLLAGSLAGVGAGRPWFTPAAGATGLVVLLALNAVNPEAFVVRHNTGRAERGQRFDAAYLASLSDDAVPAVAAALPALDPATRAGLRQHLCAGPHRAPAWWAANWSASSALETRRAMCAGKASPGGR